MGQSVTSAVLVEHPTTPTGQIVRTVGAFLASFSSPGTRRTYGTSLRQWLAWCAAHDIDPFAVRRTHVELWLRHLEDRGLAQSTRANKFTAVSSFYTWAVDEDLLPASPCIKVNAPKHVLVEQPAMSAAELHRFLAAAKQLGGYRWAILTTMALCALRVSEACQADVADLSMRQFVYRIEIVGKGDKPATIVVPPQAMFAIDEALDGRTSGPLFLNRWGNRMSRRNVEDAVNAATKAADIGRRMTPHSLRRTAIQVALAHGAPLREVQLYARHASPDTTVRYDRQDLDPSRSPGWTVMAAAA